MQYLLDTIELPDMIQGVQGGREASMQAEHLHTSHSLHQGLISARSNGRTSRTSAHVSFVASGIRIC